MKQEILQVLKKSFEKEKIKIEDEEILNSIEVPNDSSNGDFAFPFFLVSKKVKENPHEIAVRILKNIGNPPEAFEDIQVVGPYLNFYTNKKLGIINFMKDVFTKKNSYGNLEKTNKKIMIEFPSPNTNKPLHLGHLRNMSIGESVARILESEGNKVVRANLYNDRGIHICKSMAAYIKFAVGDKPTEERKGDHLVGDFYVKFNEKSKKDVELEKEAHHLLQKFEEGDKQVVQLWKTMNNWAIEGFKETYKKFGIKFDKEYFESELYQKGREIIMKGLGDGIFEKGKHGEIKINLKKEKLGEKVLLRSNGTSLYITQDIYLANKKFEDYNLDESIYVTGNEQNYHFDVLFLILEKLKIADTSKLKHLSYGMVDLPEGKMKSREGTIVDGDNLIHELQENIKKNLIGKKLSEKEIEERSLKIAVAAIKYFLLKVDINKNMLFDHKKSISSEGDTGPYLQYSYARASSIIRKSKLKKNILIPETLEEKEKSLIKILEEYNSQLSRARKEMNPTVIANYSYKLAQTFNEFYHACPVIGSENEEFRISLVATFRQLLKNCLYLIGIEAMEEM
jgi:arginyl-tRNA synthetase